MNNILITYSSKTGNTKKVAEAIKKGIPNADLIPISEVKDTEKYGLIVVGGWIDRATYDIVTQNFIKTIENKKTAFFFTLGAYPDSDHAQDCVRNIIRLLEENSNEVISCYFCQGAIAPELIEFMLKLPAEHTMAPNPERLKRWKDASSHPDNLDLEKAEEFGKSLIN